MKKLLVPVFLLMALLPISAQNEGNPFQRLGYNTPVYTFGEDKEFHDQEVIVEIDLVLYNTKTNKVVGFVKERDSLVEFAPELQSMSIDPLCEKYYSISPYAYCMNNPVKFTDPNGMWIQYYDGTNSYRYENGQWYQYQTEGENIGQYTAYQAQEGSFLDGVLTGLNLLGENSKTGKALLDFFANDDNNAFIKPALENKAVIDDTATGEIYLNKNFLGSNIPTQNGDQVSPFWLDIGHELAHRQDVIKNGAENAKEAWIKTSEKTIPRTEIYATDRENMMRSEAGLPLRTHYGIMTPGGGGWEPSRILIPGTRISRFLRTPIRIGNRTYPGFKSY